MEIYLLKSAACLGIFFLFYKLVLENTSLHTTKRFFLLSGLVLSFLIPFVTFTEYIEVTPVVTEAVTQHPITTFERTPAIIEEPINYTPYILGSIYALGVLIFSFRFGRNMLRILNKVRCNPSVKKQSILHVLLKLPITPHSFFNYIFFSKAEYEAGEIPQEVMAHETAHVEQRHSWDIVFIELLNIVFWFNPLLYFFKHSIKLNHEFLADRTVLNLGANATKYQTILLDFSSASSVPAMAHSINYSSIKKRFTVMKTHTTKRAAWLKGLLILPLLAVLIYGFSETKEEFKTPETPETVSASSTILDVIINEKNEIILDNKIIKVGDIEALVTEENFTDVVLQVSGKANVLTAKSVIAELVRLNVGKCLSVTSAAEENGGILSEEDFNEIMSPLREPFQIKTVENATPQQVEIYNKLAKKYNAIPVSERKIGWEDLKTLENIYRQMSESQKQNALPFPECLPKNQISWEQGYAKAYNDGAARNNKKSIVITINVSEVMVNGKITSLKNFAKEIDKATKDWTTADFKAAHPSVLVAGTPDSFLKKLDAEFRKTRYFKANGGESIIPTSPPPPPPAPDAPRVLKGVHDTGSNIPPPPPPPAPGAPKINKGVNSSDGNIPPPPPAPKVIKGVNKGSFNTPPPPPPPTSPLDHIIEMAKKNATFYFEGKQITSDKAIEIIKKNKDLNIQTTGSSSKNPQVKISTKPITFNSDKTEAYFVQKKQGTTVIQTNGKDFNHYKSIESIKAIKEKEKSGYFEINGETHFFIKTGNNIRYFNSRLNQEVNEKGEKIESSNSNKKAGSVENNKRKAPKPTAGNVEQVKTTLRLMLFDPPTISPNTTSKDPKQLVELLDTRGASFWNEKAKISKKDALKLIEKYSHFMIDTTQTPHDKPSIVFDVVVIK